MKTAVIVSDSHARSRKFLEQLAPLFAENDYIIHLGDGAADMREISSAYPEKTYLLRGNCDFSGGAEECVIEAEGVSLFCCHGHRYGVKGGLSRLVGRAKELGCAVALYGHTHAAAIEERDGVLCVNPGAIGSYSAPSYCYLVLHRGKATAKIIPLS